MSFTIGSLFDGSGGFPLAAFMCGGVPVWASEVEPYPIAVTKSRFPYMKHLGDISKINGAEIEPVDVISFGSPCQDLSVAGKRAGLKHEANGDEETTRSGLFMEAVRIIKEMRDATNGKYPRIALWENVPGAFSSNKGEDFRVVLEELIKIVEPTASMPAVPQRGWAFADSHCGNGWCIAYRVLDSQYIRTAQRRRRVYLVLDLGGECAREILFERESLRGNPTEGGAPWQGIASYVEGCTGVHDNSGDDSVISFEPGIAQREGGHIYEGVSGTLRANMGDNQMSVAYSDMVLDDQGGQQISVRSDGKAPTLRAEMHGNVPCVMEGIGIDTYNASETGEVAATLGVNCGMSTGRNGVMISMAFAQNQRDEIRDLGNKAGAIQAQPGMKQQTFIAAGFCTEHSAQSRGIGYEEEVSPTLRAGVTPAVVYSVENHPADSRVNIDDSGKVQTLTSRMGTGGGNVPMVMTPNPVCCLQGNGIDRADTAGCNGRGWTEDICYTLNTIDRPAVVMSLLGDEVAGTLKARDYKGIGRQDSLGSAVCLAYGMDRASFNQGKNAKYDFSIIPEQQPTMTARGPGAVCYWDGTQTCGTLTANNAGGNQRMPDKENFNCVLEERELRYIVRRLTPTECARLQGFMDKWGHIDEKESFTSEEYEFWLEVRNTHAAINGKQVKDYTEKQMLTWYNKLHTDSSEYKMWGNGIALPTALYCMQGITEALSR